jgi:hypothetical protein
MSLSAPAKYPFKGVSRYPAWSSKWQFNLLISRLVCNRHANLDASAPSKRFPARTRGGGVGVGAVGYFWPKLTISFLARAQ